MSSSAEHLPEGIAHWLAEARRGSREALGQALEGCRQYLLAVACQALPGELQGKVDPSDLVQETLLKAQQEFSSFEGDSESRLLGWLRAILVNQVAYCSRQFATDMRDVGREVSLDVQDLHETLANGVVAPEPSPEEALAAREQREAVARALAGLPEHYRRAVELRNRDNMPFAEIGRQIGVSEGAARKIWVRALRQLRQTLRGSHGVE